MQVFSAFLLKFLTGGHPTTCALNHRYTSNETTNKTLQTTKGPNPSKARDSLGGRRFPGNRGLRVIGAIPVRGVSARSSKGEFGDGLREATLAVDVSGGRAGGTREGKLELGLLVVEAGDVGFRRASCSVGGHGGGVGGGGVRVWLGGRDGRERMRGGI